MNRFLLTCLIWILSFGSIFAFQLKGKVTEENGEPIPYANVYLENTTYGVVTNIKGEFFLELDKGDYRIVFQSLGYEKKIVEVTLEGHMSIDVVMVPTALELDVVEVTAGRKDPAYAIMEKVIDNKKNFIRQFESFKCDTYLKVSLEVEGGEKVVMDETEISDKQRAQEARAARKAAREKRRSDRQAGIKDTTKTKEEEANPTYKTSGEKLAGRQKLNFIESFSTSNFVYPNQYKSIVHAFRDLTEKRGGGTVVSIGDEGMSVRESRFTPNNPLLFYTDVSDADFNFYRNLIEAYDLGDRPFISPLSSTSWRLSYKYKLEEQFMEDGRVIYKIKVTPRLKAGPYFEGHLYIVDDIWAIKSVNLKVVPSTLGFFNYFQVIHDYERVEDGRWTLSREEYYYTTKEQKQTFYGNSTALHTNYELDLTFPKRFFKNELRRVEEEARGQDSTFWNAKRPITLKTAEMAFVVERDSINAYRQSDEYFRITDSTYNKTTWMDPILNGVGIRRRAKGLLFFINPLIAQIRPLSVGGYRHALGGYMTKEFKSQNKLFVSGEVDYGFNNRDVKGNSRVGFTYNPRRFGQGYVKYGNMYTLVNNNETITAFLSRGNYINKVYYGVGHEMELVNGIMSDVSLEFADRKPIDKLQLAEWSTELFGDLNTPRSFDAYREFLVDVRLTFTPNQKYYTDGRKKIIVGSKWPTFTLRYKKGIPGVIDSEINFDFLEISAKDEFRPGTWGISRWAAKVGRFIQANNLRFTDFKFFRGSDRYFFANPLGNMQLLGPTISTKNAYFQVNYLHDFGGAVMDKIPLLNRTPLQTTAGAGVLAIEDGSFFHGELYAGIQIPFRLWRQRFKFGTYYVTSYSNFDRALNGQIKFGITFFDSFKNRWNY